MAATDVLDIENVRQRVNVELERFIQAKRRQLSGLDIGLDSLAQASVNFLSPGKRLRPAFCWWGWRGCGGEDTEAAMTAAASLELLQAFALAHDDVMDDSDTRRGQPSLHRHFATLHRNSHWHGDPDRFGRAAAILVGDAFLSWSDEMFHHCALPESALVRGQPILDAMRTEVMAGQYLDVLEQAQNSRSVERSLAVANYKTAKYTIERPLQLGAALAGAEAQTLAALTDFGLPLGEAFQLRDDILGVFGDPEQTGKPAGDDIREGKQTVLVALAYRLSGPTGHDLLDQLLGRPGTTETEIGQVRDLMTSCGARQLAETMIDDRTRIALDRLRQLRLRDEAKRVLAELAQAATRRIA